MRELSKQTLAQIVTTDHRSAAIFEKYNLDFCCRGKRTLEQACAEKNLRLDEVLGALEENARSVPKPSLSFENISLVEMTEYIVLTHHSYVKKEIPLIMGYLTKIAAKHGERHPEMVKVNELFAAIKEEMEHHMQKEELVLFPRIRETERILAENKTLAVQTSYLASPISMMEQEHEYAGSMLAEIKKLTNNYIPPPDACTTYKLCLTALEAFEKDLHQHIHLENNLLFPKALEMFQPTRCSLN